MSPQLVPSSKRSSTNGLNLVTVIHATVSSIALNGPPLEIMTQLCSVVAHVDLDIAGHVARESLRSIFRASYLTTNVQQLTA